MPLADLIESVRQVTGYPVVCKMAANLGQDVTSCLETGSPSNPVHTVVISDIVAPFQRFQLGVQCLLILLKYHDGKILELLPNPIKISAMQKALTSGKTIQSLEARVVPQLIEAILEQLTSQPLEILALYMMADRAPELEAERQLAVKALATALIAGAIDPVPMQRIVPVEIYQRNFAMNAALAWAIAEIGNDLRPLAEFRRLAFATSGRSLFAALRVIAQQYSENYYKIAVDTWAGLLKMSDWYVWDAKEAKKK